MQKSQAVEERSADIPAEREWVDEFADRLQQAIDGVYARTGESSQQIQDFLHGTWLGHPLHAALTALPLGFWTSSAALDLLSMLGARQLRAGADATLALGIVSALGTAAAGATDWQHTTGDTRRVGATHAAVNSLASVLFTGSLFFRRRQKRALGRMLSTAALGVIGYGAYLGGNLAYDRKVGVNHAPEEAGPEEFTPVMEMAQLAEGQPRRAEVHGVPLMLVRHQERVYALADTCAHLGGPLSEGKLEDDCIVCPWHGSKFRVEDGLLMRGPSVYNQPAFETRVVNGQVEVRRQG